MSKPEELRRLADALGSICEAIQYGSNGLFGVETIGPIKQAATILREYADSLEREPVAFRVRVEEMWFHAAKLDGLQQMLRIKLAREADEVQPLFTHPPRSEPPKMTDAEIESHRLAFFEANALADTEDWDLHFQDLRDKQWRG